MTFKPVVCSHYWSYGKFRESIQRSGVISLLERDIVRISSQNFNLQEYISVTQSFNLSCRDAAFTELPGLRITQRRCSTSLAILVLQWFMQKNPFPQLDFSDMLSKNLRKRLGDLRYNLLGCGARMKNLKCVKMFWTSQSALISAVDAWRSVVNQRTTTNARGADLETFGKWRS
jgi:hypothetical protein